MTITRKSVTRFLTYTSIGVSTFLFDLWILYVLVDIYAVNYVLAAGIGFLIAVSINYVLSRIFVFKRSAVSYHNGYINFLIIAGIGLLIVTGGVFLLVDVFGLHYMLGRVFVAGITGIFNYTCNLYFNFKVVGQHH